MLRPKPKEKDRLRVAIPDDLREALREAHFLINESKRDSDVRVDYGDAIQCGSLVGGKVGTSKRPFQFTYHVGEGGKKKARWNLGLSQLEIEDIADGFTKEFTLYCCRNSECGHKSSDPESLCDCDYVRDPNYGNLHFPEAADALQHWGVRGISETSTRDDVIALLGEPQASGGGEKHSTFKYIWPWIKYNRTDCQLRFEFGKGGQLKMVSVMELDWKPGK